MTRSIAIAGAGIGGLSAALALAAENYRVEIYDSATGTQDIGAGIQLSPNAMQVLNALGLGEEICNISSEPDSACIRDFYSGKVLYSLPLADVCREKFAAPYLHIHRADLHSILLNAVLNAGVQVHFKQTVLGYRHIDEKVELQLESGLSHHADLIIGADGIHSNIRSQMHGQEHARFTGYVAWRGLVPADKVPKDLIKPDATIWVGPGTHLVSYYVRGRELINFVAVQEQKEWTSESWSQAGDIQHLRNTFSDWHPSISTLLQACEKSYLWGLFDRKPLDHWNDGQVVLLGDASHPMLPFMAQGAAMALEDSYVLAKCLRENTDIATALKHYEQLRKARTSKIQAHSSANAALFHRHSGFGGLINSLKYKIAYLAPGLASMQTDYIYSHDVTK